MVGASKDLPKRHFFRPIISSDVKTCRIGNLLPIQAESLTNDGDTRNPVRPSINPEFSGSIIEGGPNQYFNPNAFLQPLPGTYGNAGRNTLQGPNLYETDLSLSRRFSLTERLGLQFRAEIFNLFNQVNFNTPNPVVYAAATGDPSPTAGVITSTATSSRQVQFGLKLLW